MKSLSIGELLERLEEFKDCGDIEEFFLTDKLSIIISASGATLFSTMNDGDVVDCINLNSLIEFKKNWIQLFQMEIEVEPSKPGDKSTLAGRRN